MIEWISLNEKQPPIGEYVLTYSGNPDWSHINTDRLNFGGTYNNTPDDRLLYWDSGSDYNDITHWAILPNLPHNATYTAK